MKRRKKRDDTNFTITGHDVRNPDGSLELSIESDSRTGPTRKTDCTFTAYLAGRYVGTANHIEDLHYMARAFWELIPGKDVVVWQDIRAVAVIQGTKGEPSLIYLLRPGDNRQPAA